ncbi:hypothetical protein A5773_03710 [Mycobacterium sp. 852014-52450_SCH5900713]|uniref:hypothetical protein n=1 Tax=Mycobacterium sp. 852014-52450_SCH5900713 TaxID=1834116 RepID=UPI0008004108|nr:hypothetical protein [Mycobacterium sp. 852014-52450_SCH5900713]OBG01140.1 hypothetical protein A5773_03710 [Mycobacterium sp. 852014-52450_SCH5900713]
MQQGPEPPSADFFEVDGRIFPRTTDYSIVEPNVDYVFALVDLAISDHQPGHRSIGMRTAMPSGIGRFPPQPIVEDALTRPGGLNDHSEFKRAYRPAG